MSQRNAASQSALSHVPTLAAQLNDHFEALRVKNYSEYTVRNRSVHIGFFVGWLRSRAVVDVRQISRHVLQDYQRHLFHYRKRDGEPLSFRSQHAYLVPVRMWFRWMTRQNRILRPQGPEPDSAGS